MPVVPRHEVELFPAYRIYDLSDGIKDPQDPDISVPCRGPSALSVEGMDGTNAFTIQVKLEKESQWLDYIDVDNTEVNALVVFDVVRFNFVRVVRSGAGTNAPIVYAQQG